MAGAGKVHCTWCGAVVSGGGRFCASCGQPVDEHFVDDEEDYDAVDYGPGSVGTMSLNRPRSTLTDARNTERDESEGLLGKLASALGTLIAVPLGLLAAVISFAIPILIVFALLAGPGDTWRMLSAWVPGSGGDAERSGCADFDDWFDVSNERGSRLYALVEPVQKREVENPAALRDISADIRAIVTEQRQSDPPPEAQKLNSLLADMYDLLAQGTLARANDDYSNMQSFDAQYRDLVSQADTEDKRVRQACL